MKKQLGQLGLFPELETHIHRFKLPMQYAEIIEDNGEEYPIWFKSEVYSLAQLKKIAAKLYNKQKGYNPENYVKFGKIEWTKKEMKGGKGK